MKSRHLLFWLCLGVIFFIEPLAAIAGIASSVANISTVAVPPAVNQGNFQASIAQVIESPATSPQDNSTNLIIDSPGVDVPDTSNLVIDSPSVGVPDTSTNLVIDSPSVSPLLPREVAEAEGYTLERRNKEKQNIEQYQASLLAANSENNAQQPDPEETSPPSDIAPTVVEETIAATDTDALVVESPGEPAALVTEPSENSVSAQGEKSASTLAKKVELEELTFQCSDNNGIPTTVAKVKDGDELPLILWVSDFFKSAGYDAKARCNQVSARFAAYSKDNPLAYLTTGEMNGQSVVCFTSNSDSGCGEGISRFKGLLFTLKSTDDSQQVLKNLVAVLQNKTTSEQAPLEQ